MKKRELFEQFIVAIDYDKTLAQTTYPDVGALYPSAKEVINKWVNQGIYIIIWTCRTGESALKAESSLLENGLFFHKFNDHHPNGLLHYGSEIQMEQKLYSRKVWSHVLIDDTSIDWVLNGHPGWINLDKMMQQIIENLGDDNKYNLKSKLI